MDFGTEAGIFLAYACGLLAICFFGKIFLIPVKFLSKLVINSVLGGLILVVLNTVLNNFGIILPINGITAAAAGLLGVPGTVVILIYSAISSLF